MQLEYVPLLRVARELHAMPLGMARFGQYLRTIMNQDGTDVELTPLLAMNPMGKDHVAALLDALLEMDADGIAARASEEVSARLAEVPGNFRTGLVVADDLKGGWTNRYDWEFTFRFGPRPLPLPDRFGSERMRRRFWVTGVLWSSEPPTARAVREAIFTVAYRMDYAHRHGTAFTIRDMMAQEGSVMASAGCTGPMLEPDDLEYTREVLAPFLDEVDKRTAIECLFGDAAGRTLGFTPRGLSPWAGLALALHDARRGQPSPPEPASLT
jgi:hypothetical protein